MKRTIYWTTVLALLGVILACFEVYSSTHGVRVGCRGAAGFAGLLVTARDRPVEGRGGNGKGVAVHL